MVLSSFFRSSAEAEIKFSRIPAEDPQQCPSEGSPEDDESFGSKADRIFSSILDRYFWMIILSFGFIIFSLISQAASRSQTSESESSGPSAQNLQDAQALFEALSIKPFNVSELWQIYGSRWLFTPEELEQSNIILIRPKRVVALLSPRYGFNPGFLSKAFGDKTLLVFKTVLGQCPGGFGNSQGAQGRWDSSIGYLDEVTNNFVYKSHFGSPGVFSDCRFTRWRNQPYLACHDNTKRYYIVPVGKDYSVDWSSSVKVVFWKDKGKPQNILPFDPYSGNDFNNMLLFWDINTLVYGNDTQCCDVFREQPTGISASEHHFSAGFVSIPDHPTLQFLTSGYFLGITHHNYDGPASDTPTKYKHHYIHRFVMISKFPPYLVQKISRNFCFDLEEVRVQFKQETCSIIEFIMNMETTHDGLLVSFSVNDCYSKLVVVSWSDIDALFRDAETLPSS